MQEDTARALAAARMIINGRDPKTEASSIMVTTEHAVATVLLAIYDDPRTAAAMLNEALVQGVEARLAHYGAKKPK